MRTFRILSAIAGCAAMVIASTPALAQQAQATKLSGTASGSGIWSRTIIDIGGEPNGPLYGPVGIMSIQGGIVNVPYSIGENADTIGTHMRNAVNAAGFSGYSSRPTTPSAVTKLSRPKITRQTGSFNITDSSPPPGVTVAADAFTVEDAPAASPAGLALLAAALAATVWVERRRRRRAAA
jgi:hypothetical protein